MSEVTEARDWARQMEAADHRPDCQIEKPLQMGAFVDLDAVEVVTPDPACEGCVTDSDRALWGRIADEYDRHLGQDTSWGPRPLARAQAVS